MSEQQTPNNQDLRKAGFSQAQIDLMTEQQQQQQYNELMDGWYSSKRGKRNESTRST